MNLNIISSFKFDLLTHLCRNKYQNKVLRSKVQYKHRDEKKWYLAMRVTHVNFFYLERLLKTRLKKNFHADILNQKRP